MPKVLFFSLPFLGPVNLAGSLFPTGPTPFFFLRGMVNVPEKKTNLGGVAFRQVNPVLVTNPRIGDSVQKCVTWLA